MLWLWNHAEAAGILEMKIHHTSSWLDRMLLFIFIRQALAEVRGVVVLLSRSSCCVTAGSLRALSSLHKPPLSCCWAANRCAYFCMQWFWFAGYFWQPVTKPITDAGSWRTLSAGGVPPKHTFMSGLPKLEMKWPHRWCVCFPDFKGLILNISL